MSSNNFDPHGPGKSEGIFGLPFTPKNAALVLIPAPFEATTSYGGGTAKAPQNMFTASQQVDLFHPLDPNAWKLGIALAKEVKEIRLLNSSAKKLVSKLRQIKDSAAEKKMKAKLLKEVNKASEKVNSLLKAESEKYLNDGKIVGVIGGDHSVPFASIASHLKRYPKMGILHFDAHFDLRDAYEGFLFSHASIFHNVMTRLPLKHLTQIGIRDYSSDEIDFANSRKSELTYFLDSDIFERKARGENWQSISRAIVESLPQEVYVSFDIDGLEPNLCPGTGTPVPGGLQFQEAISILRQILASKRKIIGFDLCEVGAGEYDGNVGARILFELCNLSLISMKR
jgi:agmatinase